MKKLMLSDWVNNHSVSKRIFALLIAILMLAFTGCTPKENTSTPTTSNPSSQNSSVASDPASEDSSLTDSSKNDVTSTGSSNKKPVTITASKLSPLDGSITASVDVQSGQIRTDIDEYGHMRIPYQTLGDGQYAFDGYAKTEADAMREKILNTPNTQEIYDIKGTIYYVSPSGNNENSGTSPDQPLLSVDGVEQYDLKPGDAVLFERNSVFRFYEYIYLKTGVIYGSYGEGRKPMFIGSPKNYVEEAWQPSNKRNVWVIDFPYGKVSGVFLDQGKEAGNMKYDMRNLKANTDYYFDMINYKFYFYCDKGNPSLVYDSMEIVQYNSWFRLSAGVKDVVIDNITLRYTASGVGGAFANHGLTVTNCEVGYTGGMQGNSVVRSGNAIGLWNGGHDLIVDNCWIYQTFDSAISPQGNAGGDFYYENISYCNNLFEYNNTDIELWSQEKSTATTNAERWSKFINVHMENNIMRFTSGGWGTRKNDGGIRGIEGVLYGHMNGNEVRNMTFYNNIIDCPARKIFDFKLETMQQYNNFLTKDNKFYIKSDLRTQPIQVRGITNPLGVLTYSGNTKETVEEGLLVFDKTAKVYFYE